MRNALLALLLLGSAAFAAESKPATATEMEAGESTLDRIKRHAGLTYFTFFDGPGLTPEFFDATPNWLGNRNDDGLSFFHLVSAKWKFSERWALDLQMRIQTVVNNAAGRDDFAWFRWQSPRIGISGKLAGGEEWSLSGAVNTDFPYGFPSPFGGGFLAAARKTLFTPGMFASFNYRPTGSRWSFFSLIAPRYFFYEDPNAAEPQLIASGFGAQAKPEFIIQLFPTVSYDLNDLVALRAGVTLDIRKLVLSDWNPFNMTMNTAEVSPAWRFWAMPAQLGVNFNIDPALNLFVFSTVYPIAAQRTRADGSVAGLLETAWLGMWLSGTIL